MLTWQGGFDLPVTITHEPLLVLPVLRAEDLSAFGVGGELPPIFREVAGQAFLKLRLGGRDRIGGCPALDAFKVLLKCRCRNLNLLRNVAMYLHAF